jgi:hypothetical protein
VATPDGDVPVTLVREGMVVWTANAQGERVRGVVLRSGSVETPPDHRVVRLTLADGREVEASAGHPSADGRSFGELKVGDAIDHSVVLKVASEAYGSRRTYDLLPSGATGQYWANGVRVGSTLKR